MKRRAETMKWFGLPGVGGSLGRCAICGKDFGVEIMLGKPCLTFSVTGITEKLCAHDKCKKFIPNGKNDWKDLPPGPLRKAFENAQRHPTKEG